MKSTFKKDYQRIERSDGVIALRFRDDRINTSAASAFIGIAVLFFICIAGAVAVMISIESNREMPWPVVMLIALGLILFVKLLSNRKRTISITPFAGMSWSRQSLPFSDMDSVGIETHGDGDGFSSFLYVETGGRKVKLTRFMPAARAQAIRQEIKSLSGQHWA